MTNTNTAEQTYLYSVHPRTIIKELPVAPIRVPKSLYLTKDQVLICLKHGAVYRRFANEGKNERVTITNVDRLHNEKFMTEEQYAAFLQSGVADNRGTIIGDIVTPDKDQDETEVDSEKENESETTGTEESENNNPEQTVETAAENEEVTETEEEEDECAACNIDYSQLESTETTEEDAVEESTEQEVEEEAASESVETVTEQTNNNGQQNWNNNNGKNKHGKHHR